MNRAKIQQALLSAIKDCGLSSIISPVLDASTLLSKLPAIWFSSPNLISVEGRDGGRIEYSLSLAAIYDCKGQSDEEKGVTLSEMEQKLLSVLTFLSHSESVITIDEITIKQLAKPTNRVGDLVLSCSCEITTFF